jgi:hypothetical protein
MALFQIKNFVSIVASMINRMKATQSTVTDFNVGAVGRTLVEAPAIEIDQLYQQMLQGLTNAIPVATFNSFSFAPLPAVPASQLFTATITAQPNNVLIPAGTTFTFPGGQTGYQTSSDMTITAGNTTGTVLASALVAGSLGNIPANTSFQMTPVPAGFVSATNPSAIQNGLDAETPAQQQVRFAQFIASLPRGTIAAIIFGAKTTQLLNTSGLVTEQVKNASVIEPFVTDNTQPIALVNVFVHNGVGATSPALVAQAQQVINGFVDSAGVPHPGWKAAGVIAVVIAAQEANLNMNALLTAAPGFSSASLVPLAVAAINSYALGLDLGATFILSEAVDLVMNIPGVTNFVPGVMTPPALPSLTETRAGALAPTTYFVKTTYVNSKGETLASAEATENVGVATPAAAPTLSQVAGGTIAATTYFAKITYVNALGETLASAESSLAVAANSVLRIASPPASGDATGYNVYVSTATGTETKQNAVPIAIGTAWTEPTTGLIAGAAVPASSTALGVLVVNSPAPELGATGYNVYASSATGTETKQNAAPIAIGTAWNEPVTGLIAGAAPPATNTAFFTDGTTLNSQKPMPGTTTITATN